MSRARAVPPPVWQLKSSAQASSSPHPSGSRGDFPAGRAQGTGPATCCGSRAQLRAKTAAGGGRLREEEERDLLGMPPRSRPAPGPATRKRACGAGPLVTQPSHTAPPAPADHTLLFSHNPHEMQKWGAKLSTGTAAARGAELSVSLSSGQEQPGKLVLPATRDPAERRRVCKLFPYSHAFWSWIRPSFPKALGDANHRSRVHPVSRRGPEVQHPAVQGAAARVLLQVPPPVPPPQFSTCRGCGYAGDTCTRNPTTRFSFKKQSLLLCSF